MPEGNSTIPYAELAKKGSWKAPLGWMVAIGILVFLITVGHLLYRWIFSSKTDLHTYVASVQKEIVAINQDNGCWRVSEAELETSVSSKATTESGVQVTENKVGSESESGHVITLTLVPNPQTKQTNCGALPPAQIVTEHGMEANTQLPPAAEETRPRKKHK